MTGDELKLHIARRFGRAAAHYEQHNKVQQQSNLLLQPFVKQSDLLVDLGCGPGSSYKMLRHKCERYLGIDLSDEMLHQASGRYKDNWLQADAEALPLASDSVDLIYSNLALQWCMDRKELGHELFRVLRPGGRIVCSVILERSMQPLQRYLNEAEAAQCVNRQPALTDWEDALENAGFRLIQKAEQFVTEWFTDLHALLDSIKGVGAGMVVSPERQQSQQRLTRGRLRKLSELYEGSRCNGKLPLSYHIGVLVADRSGTP